MSSRFREAASHFTLDTIYSHPPYAGGRQRVLFRGREALRRGFVIERGPSPARQVITGFWQRGARVFVEGVIEGIPDGGTFFSTAQISPRVRSRGTSLSTASGEFRVEPRTELM